MTSWENRLNLVVANASQVFGQHFPPYQGVPLPNPFVAPSQKRSGYFEVSALYTRDGLRPRWGNLGAVVDRIEASHTQSPQVLLWKDVLDNFGLALAVLVAPTMYVLVERFDDNLVVAVEADEDLVREALLRCKESVFSPRNLGTLRTGQLSLGDLEDSFAEHTFAYHYRHRIQISDALQNALVGALQAQTTEFPGVQKIADEKALSSLVNVSIAYLAARIMEDKGILDYNQNHDRTNDPRLLLQEILSRRNGFFEVASKSVALLSDDVLKQLALHLGRSVTFSLVDHKDVGYLYEHAVQIFRALRVNSAILEKKQIVNLQQHYTPQAIADRMLDALPLERMHPEKRVIFDPAFGSGSLLLAATRRLILMPDVHAIARKEDYLAKHVMGNDLDENARLIAKLRYSLAQEAFGYKELFPDPEYFGEYDYEKDTAWELPRRPSVVVANPPFAEDQASQRAVEFLKVVLNKLQVDDQFAFVLPQSFLTGITHGWNSVRKLMSEKCQLLETWQLPEGAVGLSARQPVCFVMGVAGIPKSMFAVSRAIISGAQIDTVRDRGFLGQTWLANAPIATIDWREIVAPVVRVRNPTIPLGELMYICTGVGLRKGFKPISTDTGNINTKMYWQNKWRRPDTIWANPNFVPENERFIRFSKQYLEGHRSSKEYIYDGEKLLIGRIINKNSKEPLAVRIDTEGLCPDKNVFCLIPHEISREPILVTRRTPVGWDALSTREKLLWILGTLSSKSAIDMSLPLRSARQINSGKLAELPLPNLVDVRIVEIMKQMFSQEQEGKFEQRDSVLWTRLDEIVEDNYGLSRRLSLTRTGKSSDFGQWQKEVEQPKVVVTGQVLDVDVEANKVYLFLQGLMDDDIEAWITIPSELPGWALDGVVFEADLSDSVETFSDISLRPWALQNFKHTPRPYLSVEELQKALFSDSEQGGLR